MPATCVICPRQTNGAIGGGFEFTREPETLVRVTPVDPEHLDGSGGFTLAAFVRANALPMNPDGSILSKQLGGGSELSYWVGIWQSNLEVWIGAVRKLVSPVAFGPGEIAHIAVTWAPGEELALYQNGALSGTSSIVAPGFDDNPVAIGAWEHQPTIDELWDGMLDEVRIYDRALDVSEIGELAECE